MLRSIYVSILSQIWSFYSLCLSFWDFDSSSYPRACFQQFPVFYGGIIIRSCCWYIRDVKLVLPAVQSFRFHLISFFSLLQHDTSSHIWRCLRAVCWWQQHSWAVTQPRWPCYCHLLVCAAVPEDGVKAASRAMQLQNEPRHCPVPSSSLCSCLSPIPQLPSPGGLTSWCSFSKEINELSLWYSRDVTHWD